MTWLHKLKQYMYSRSMKRKYPDWEDNEYNCGALKFIWGVKSAHCLSSENANLHTINDIDIVYSRETKRYYLNIETSYLFEEGQVGQAEYAEYLDGLLNEFTKFMEKNKHDIGKPCTFFQTVPVIECVSDNIPDLYSQFRIFVEGFKAVYSWG